MSITVLRRLGLTACLSFASSSSFATDLYSIYQLAVQNDHEFAAANAAYQAGLENKGLGRAGILPKFNANASYANNDVEQDGESVQLLLPNETNATDSGYGLTLSQPLFDMAAWNTYQAGKDAANIAEAQFRSDQQSLIIRTAQAYFDTLQAADNLSTSVAEEDAFKHQLEQTQQRFEVGLSAITDVHEAQASYDNSVAEKLIAIGQLGIAFEALEVLTGETYYEINPLKDDFVVSKPQPEAREEWVKRSIEGNYDLAAAEANAEASRHQAKAAKAGHYPVLSLDGSYSSRNNDGDFTYQDNPAGKNDYDTDSTQIGVTLTIPIYNGGGVSASRRQAAQQSIQARELWLKAKRDVVQAARTQHLAVTTTVATVKARKQAIVSNASALEATQAGYSVGTRDLVDVLNAQRGLYQAKRDYYAALYTYVISSLTLKQVAGMLVEDDVVQLNSWLDTERKVEKNTSL
ncbi:TolC family outer membrane protein [Agaribacterium haliotis]|uniref:TolC family outer membrane protein n=1 Tax=Agaribacterium haliotis TaxID=2013869 RepID=UPI000BB597C5|nr:TolC family outer membrane protein [Agaribacterium haliotis]